jgi:hypothetical protein
MCKPVLKLDFTALGIMESLSEFGLGETFVKTVRRMTNKFAVKIYRKW